MAARRQSPPGASASHQRAASISSAVASGLCSHLGDHWLLVCQTFLERNHKVSDEFGAQPAHAFHASQHCATMSAEKANHEQLSVTETAMSVFGRAS